MKAWFTFGSAFTAALLTAGCAGMQGGAQDQDRNGMVLLGEETGLEGWEQVGPGRFVTQPDGSIVSEGGMGLLYYNERPFRDFALELDYKTETPGANSGIFVRFPERPDDPMDAVRGGYEIQIDDNADPTHMTGSIYDIAAPSQLASRPSGEWNHYRIEVSGQRYQVYLNGEKVNDFIGERGREGFIGLQNHDPDSRVRFRNVRVTPLDGANAPESLADLFAVREEREPIRVLMLTATHGFRHGDAIEAAKQVMENLETTTEFEFDTTEDLSVLTRENLANYDLVFLANATLRAELPEEPEAVEGATAYAITITPPDGGPMTGRLVLADEDGEPSGTIAIGGGEPTPLQNLRITGPNIAFAFDGGAYGEVNAMAQRQGETIEGSLRVGGGAIPLTGTRTGVAGQAGAAAFTPVTEAQKEALLEFVRSGKGLVLAHSALDAFYSWDDYREMIGGGLFEAHPWTQNVRINVEDPSSPAVQHIDGSFWLRDEIYVLDQNPRWNSRVLLSLDIPSVQGDSMSADATPDDYPISWIRPYGEGRIFATSLGHFADVWRSPVYLQHLLQGMRMAAERVPADFSGHRIKETIADNVWPDDVVADKEGNVWIGELRGKVWRYDNETKQTQLVAELNTTNPAQIEHGLYGVEVDPNFYDGEPYIYIFYAEPETFVNTLSRFTYANGKLDMSSEKVLLRVPTEPQCCHQAGDLEWGPNQTLFISTGDTGQSGTKPDQEISEERIAAFVERNELSGYHWSRLVDSERTSQNLQSLRGKVLRINKDGTIPKDNPFYGEPGVRWEIYAYGLRNPYRIQFDDETGRLFIGVVGPDEQTTYDEYNVASGGENFGWPRDNGRLFYNEWKPEMIQNWAPPFWEYTYATGSRSASGGPVYRSEGKYAFPQLQGKVITYDWSRRWIKYGDLVNGTFVSDTTGDVKGEAPPVRRGAKRMANVRTFDVLEGTSPISMDVGPDGCIYVAEFAGFWTPGEGANVSRYCWVEEDEAAPATTTAAAQQQTADAPVARAAGTQ